MCVCVLVTLMYCAKKAEPVEMPFVADSYGPKEQCIRWSRDLSHGKGVVWPSEKD